MIRLCARFLPLLLLPLPLLRKSKQPRLKGEGERTRRSCWWVSVEAVRRFGIQRCYLCAQPPPRKFQCANQQQRLQIAGWSPRTSSSHGAEPRTTFPLRAAAAAAAAPELSVMTCAQPTGVSRCSSLTRMLRRSALNELHAACWGTQVHHRPPR